MALFSTKKTAAKVPHPGKTATKKADKAEVVSVPAGKPASGAGSANASITAQHVISSLIQIRITEKASMVHEGGVYTFNVAVGSTKNDIMKAVQQVYKVIPRKVNIVTILAKAKRNSRTGRSGMTAGGKKAYVYLKKGDSINL